MFQNIFLVIFLFTFLYNKYYTIGNNKFKPVIFHLDEKHLLCTF